MYPFRHFEFRRSPIAVVGAACPLGRALVPVLLDSGYRVRAVVHDTSRIPAFWRSHPHCEISLTLAGERRLVWLAHAHHVDPRIEVQANVGMMEAACRVDRRLVFVSSGGAVYGDPTALPVPEEHPRRPRSAYGMAKCVMEDIVATAAARDGGSVILRPGNIYGAGYLRAARGGVVTAFVNGLAADRPLLLRDGGRGARDYVFVDDVVQAIVAAVEWRGALRVWNVGTGVATPARDILRKVAAILGREPAAIVHQQRAPGDVDVVALSYARIEQDCGWRPVHTLATGLPLTLRNFSCAPGEREPDQRTGRDTGTGLPNFAGSTTTFG
jgi:UDP-glucose 4-epimerase